MDKSGIYIPENLIENFKLELQTFYYQIITGEMNIAKNAFSIKKAWRQVSMAYWRDTVKSGTSTIRYDTVAKRCAYIMKYSPCFTSAVAEHLMNVWKQKPYILQETLRRRRLNVCCLGGGPGTDAVGISKIVHAALDHSRIRDLRPLEFHVTVVDHNENWQITAKKVLQALEQTQEFFDPARMTLNLRFIKADLTQPLTDEVQEALNNADVVTMVYFVSAVVGSRLKDKAVIMIKRILQCLKKGAILFLLDSALGCHYEVLNAMAEFIGIYEQIYGPQQHKLHMLSLDSVKKYLELYSKHMGHNTCLTDCMVCASAWLKTKDSSTILSTSKSDLKKIMELSKLLEIFRGANFKRKKRAFKNRKVQSFRQKVQRLLLAEWGLDYDIDDLGDAESDFESTESDYPQCSQKVLFQAKSKRKRIFTNSIV